MNRVITNIDYDKYDNFIFDLYGTLIDLHTDERSTLTWKKWMKWHDDNNIKPPTPSDSHLSRYKTLFWR